MLNLKKADCPFWRGPCRKHDCRMYKLIQGRDPVSGAEINEWDCTLAMFPLLFNEMSYRIFNNAATMQELRNEQERHHKMNAVIQGEQVNAAMQLKEAIERFHKDMAAMNERMIDLARDARTDPLLIDGKDVSK